MVKRNLIAVIVSVILIYFFFISGKRSNHPDDIEKANFVANPGLFYNMDKLYAAEKAEEIKGRLKRLNKKGIFNGTVLYAENGKIVFEGAYGYKDFRKRDTMTVNSAFQLASVSKMFTAMSIMILHERGKLDYDDTITRFIPEFPFGNVTLRNLLNHRSGLSRYMSLTDKYWDINKPIDNEQVIDLFVKYKPAPYFQPDHGFHYCNTNYALLASVVERITGMHFDDFVKQEIFEPLGMDHSFIYNLRGESSISSSVPVGVPGYRYGGRYARKMGNYYLNGVMGDKGVYSTVEDLYKFSLALDQGTLVPLSSVREAFEPGSPNSRRRKDNYGFGWRIRGDMDSTVYHFGWWKGFRTFFIRDRYHNRTLIALTNTNHGVSSSVFWDMVKDDDRDRKQTELFSALK